MPASFVGFAGEFSGIHPRESPGGWPLIGQTDPVVWDVNRPDPALLTSHKWVQFWEARWRPSSPLISLGSPHYGLRSYLAVRGGIDVEPVLGSRSSDVMSGIGPQPLQPGDVLPVDEHTTDFPELDQAPVASFTEDPIELNVVPGPRDDWFIDPDALVHSEWVASDRSDRVGMRLNGRPLRHRWPDRQLPSEGATRGAIQVLPDGLPVILGPDHPVTGSYPVTGVVTNHDIDRVAQIRPGQQVRLHWSRPLRRW